MKIKFHSNGRISLKEKLRWENPNAAYSLKSKKHSYVTITILQ